MGDQFGERLRDERERRGISQAALASGYCSASYISLLESGLREPAADVIHELANRLQGAGPDLECHARPYPAGDTDFVLGALNAREAWDIREYAQAAAHADSAAESALQGHHYSDWWSMKYLQAESLMKLGKFAESLDLVSILLEHQLVAQSTPLAARTYQVAAAAYHGLGHVDLAIGHARRAIGLASEPPVETTVWIDALGVLISSLADSGQLEEAWKECHNLDSLTGADSGRQTSGQAAWIIGNVALLRSDYEEGIRRHEEASACLRPADDIELWARFNIATASGRLAAGITGPETLTAIERAERALEIAGKTPRTQLEVAFLRASWLYLFGDVSTAAGQLEEICADRELMGHHQAGVVALQYGRAIRALGFDERALELVEEARQHFMTAGSWMRASQCVNEELEIRISDSTTKS